MVTEQQFRLIGQVKLFTENGFQNKIREIVDVFLRDVCEPDQLQNIIIATAEIAQNIFKHGYQGQVNAPVVMSIYLSEIVRITFIDQSDAPIKPIKQHMQTGLQVGRRGLAIVDKIALNYQYQRREESGSMQSIEFSIGKT